MDEASDGAWNHCRYRPGAPAGHYESYFQRANHPARARAFWIRYTLFSPRGRPRDAVGERWAIFFDGDAGRVISTKEVVPIASCSLSDRGLDVRLGDAHLEPGRLAGSARSGGHRIGWDLTYAGGQAPLLLLPRRYYEGGFPKAKVVVPHPNVTYAGHLTVDDERVAVDGWRGSQNHNWGVRHTDHYAWGQVAGFDGVEDAFLECSTARVRLGPLWSPFLTMIVLRLDGEEHALNGLWQGLRARGRFSSTEWRFASRRGDLRLSGWMRAERRDFVTLTYDNPPGGSKVCLNSKLADCELTVERSGKPTVALRATRRAAFEILSDPP